MKYYTICYPGEFGQHVQETFTREQAIASYFEYWSMRMQDAGKPFQEITLDNCFIDWLTVNWAYETDERGLRS